MTMDMSIDLLTLTMLPKLDMEPGDILVIGTRAVIAHPDTLAKLEQKRHGGWSRYTIGNWELSRDRRRYPRPPNYIIHFDDKLLYEPPDPIQFAGLLSPRDEVKLGYDHWQRMHDGLVTFLGRDRVTVLQGIAA